MAVRTCYPSLSYNASRVYIEFSFQANAGSQIVQTTVAGAPCVANLNRTGTGIIVVTLTDPIFKVIACSADVDDTANDGAYATCSNVTNENTTTPLQFTIRTRSAAGAAADMAAGRKIQVIIAVKQSSQGLV